MFKKVTFSLLAAALAVRAAEGASDVTQLTKDTFDDFVKSHDLVLAECKFCLSDRGLPRLTASMLTVDRASLRPVVVSYPRSAPEHASAAQITN